MTPGFRRIGGHPLAGNDQIWAPGAWPIRLKRCADLRLAKLSLGRRAGGCAGTAKVPHG
jgi:hypothetical protein